MKTSSIYHVCVEGEATCTEPWVGTFDWVPEKSDILEAIELDILDLSTAVEHEADRIRDYRILQEVVRSISHMETVQTVYVAGTKIGKIHVSEKKIFTK